MRYTKSHSTKRSKICLLFSTISLAITLDVTKNFQPKKKHSKASKRKRETVTIKALYLLTQQAKCWTRLAGKGYNKRDG